MTRLDINKNIDTWTAEQRPGISWRPRCRFRLLRPNNGQSALESMFANTYNSYNNSKEKKSNQPTCHARRQRENFSFAKHITLVMNATSLVNTNTTTRKQIEKSQMGTGSERSKPPVKPCTSLLKGAKGTCFVAGLIFSH